jgi:lipoprotein-releasing system permease protein
LFSKKKQNIINIISAVSVAGIIVGTTALVIVLSVLNGFIGLIDNFYSSFDPDLKITPVRGKMFDPSKYNFEKIKKLPGVVHYAEIIEEAALLKYGKQQYFATIKGVPENYANYTKIDSLIVDGSFQIWDKQNSYAAVGQGVAFNLGIGLTFVDPIRIFVPRKGKQTSLNPSRAIKHNYIYPTGIFSVLEEIDLKYVIVPFEFAADLFESDTLISSVELGIENPEMIHSVQNNIEEILGEGFHVKNKFQQHDLIYKTMESEKWAAYLILIFILIIASFNILSSLSMLIIDKKDDIMILKSMGATPKLIRRIFLLEGWLISLLGAIIGTLLGIFICWLQVTFEIIQLPGTGSFIISAYPVKVIFSDILWIFGMVVLIGFLASWYPVRFISQKYGFSQNI